MRTNKIGTMIGFSGLDNLRLQLSRIRDMDMNACQLGIWDIRQHTDENAEGIKRISEESGVEITAIWAGWDGPAEWNFYGGPATLGIVPPAYRASRLKQLFSAADFAYKLGITDIITHVGFIPENPFDENFNGTVCALRSLAKHIRDRGQYFLFETGQETPVTMLRAIEEIGTDNLGINLDTANLILYGKANTADALEVFGKYVRNTHCKDGFYPTNGRELGVEAPLGEGRADIEKVVRKLDALGYTGPYIIEREISGEKQNEDILKARDLIKGILEKL